MYVKLEVLTLVGFLLAFIDYTNANAVSNTLNNVPQPDAAINYANYDPNRPQPNRQDVAPEYTQNNPNMHYNNPNQYYNNFNPNNGYGAPLISPYSSYAPAPSEVYGPPQPQDQNNGVTAPLNNQVQPTKPSNSQNQYSANQNDNSQPMKSTNTQNSQAQNNENTGSGISTHFSSNLPNPLNYGQPSNTGNAAASNNNGALHPTASLLPNTVNIKNNAEGSNNAQPSNSGNNNVGASSSTVHNNQNGKHSILPAAGHTGFDASIKASLNLPNVLPKVSGSFETSANTPNNLNPRGNAQGNINVNGFIPNVDGPNFNGNIATSSKISSNFGIDLNNKANTESVQGKIDVANPVVQNFEPIHPSQNPRVSIVQPNQEQGNSYIVDPTVNPNQQLLNGFASNANFKINDHGLNLHFGQGSPKNQIQIPLPNLNPNLQLQGSVGANLNYGNNHYIQTPEVGNNNNDNNKYVQVPEIPSGNYAQPGIVYAEPQQPNKYGPAVEVVYPNNNGYYNNYQYSNDYYYPNNIPYHNYYTQPAEKPLTQFVTRFNKDLKSGLNFANRVAVGGANMINHHLNDFVDFGSNVANQITTRLENDELFQPNLDPYNKQIQAGFRFNAPTVNVGFNAQARGGHYSNPPNDRVY